MAGRRVYSYDHRGRPECEIRIDDALGISVTYFSYDAGGNLTCLRTVDALRNHATWYDYDRLGRVTELRTALSAAGPLFGIGLNPTGAPAGHRCYSVMLPSFVPRPAEPDVTYTYDALGRVTSVVHQAAVPSGATETERTYHWRLPMIAQRTETVTTPPALIAAHHRMPGIDLRVTDRADTVGAAQRIGTVEYDDKGRVVDVTSAPGDPLTYEYDVLSRRERTDVQSTPAAARDYTYVTAGTELVRVDNTPNTNETLDQLSDEQGRVRRRVINGPPGTVTEDLSFGYHDRLLRLEINDQARVDTCGPSEPTDSSNHSLRETWAYRYGPGGLREQKRLVTDRVDDRTLCGVAPWTHYVRSPGGDPLVVYHGRQTSENPCSVEGLGFYDRRVHIYAHEYRVYGPDGLKILFERNAQGAFVKRAVTLNEQGSIATVTDAAGYQHTEIHDDHGERATTPQRRTGWLDRELDYETAPGHPRHKLYDLDHRKYDAATSQFLSVDPLWPMYLESGSYVYCTGDAVNMVDPWGLSGSGAINPDPSISTFNDEGIVGASPFIVGWQDDYEEPTPLAAGKDNSGWIVRFDWQRGLNIGVRTEEPIVIPYLPNNHWSKKTPWMTTAKGEIGVFETDGSETTPRVQEYHNSVRPSDPLKGDDDYQPWCGSFAFWCLAQNGIPGVDVNPYYSLNWAKWGMDVLPRTQNGMIDVARIPYGALVVIRWPVTKERPKVTGHVGFAAGYTSDGKVILLGGNQTDEVRYTPYSVGNIVAIRYPIGFTPTATVPLVNLSKNSSPGSQSTSR